MNRSHLRGIAFLAVGLTALAVALLTTHFRFFAIVLALGCFLVGGTILSQAGQLARSLAPFVTCSVRVEVWGTPLPASDDSPFEVDSIKAVGAGLLIHLRRGSGGARTLLKVAQPRSARIEEHRVEISQARYVSWAGTRLKPDSGHPAVVLFT